MLPQHNLPEMLDAGWVFTDYQLRKILDRPNDASRVPFQGRFTPSDKAVLIGDAFHENPVAHPGVKHQRLNLLDLHTSCGMASRCSFRYSGISIRNRMRLSAPTERTQC